MIYLNGQKLDFKTFPNGETLVDGEQIFPKFRRAAANLITLKYENDSDLIRLMFLKRHLDNNGAAISDLRILYMPYSRMDRVEGNSVFTLKYVSEFINSLNFESITVLEPHSDVTMALLDKASSVYPTFDLVLLAMDKIGFNPELDYLMFPDVGAAKRYSKIGDYKTLIGNKVREFATGKIIKYDILGAEDTLFGTKVIIVDDLCSYGGTFYRKDNEGVETGAAAELKKLGAAEIYLVVAHAEFSIYEGSIFTGESPVDKVFTTNSIIELDSNEKLEVLDII
jgi:ribose-phosphate pyrophosphokinase